MAELKIGQTVWETDGVRLYKHTITKIVSGGRFTIYYTENGGIAFDDRAISHSLFLTKEEAERRLIC